MSLFTSYHPGPSPPKVKWPGKNAAWWRKLWFRWQNLTLPQRRKRHYHRYLKSRAWADKRQVILARDGYACRSCGSGNYLDVHHLTYARFGYEHSSDLVTVCRNCHQAIHGRRF